MSIKGKGVLLAVGALGLILAGAGPALAQGHGGGGHASAGGHGGGGGGGHGAVGHAGGGGHFAGGGHVASTYRGSYAGSYGGHGGYAGRGGYGGHGGYAGRGGYGGHGYSTGGRGGYWGGGWHGGWGGGYWRGGFWPRAYYGSGFAWFLPILPLAYATYWYSGVPYYYADDVYYTWNPSYEGYTATDPPPVVDSSGGAEGAGPAPNDAGAPNVGPGPGGPVAGQIFMYPKNGQSAEQQSSDRAECQKWATDQAGQVAQNGSDYNRAMVACVEGRGYSAR